MGDIIDSITKWVKERSTSPMYGTFIFSVILWNWKFFYVLFWQEEEKLSLPRIEYVQQNFLNSQTWPIHITFFCVLPLVSTYIIIWWLPLLNNWVHKKHLSFYYSKKSIIDSARLDYEKKQEKNLKLISLVKKEQVEARKEINKNVSQEDRLILDFEEFKKMKSYHEVMKQIKDAIYDNNGRLMLWNGVVDVAAVTSDNLAVADSKKIVILSGVGDGRKIELTEKGKFFMEKYLEDVN